MYQFFPYIIFSILSFITVILLAVYALHHKKYLVVNEFVFGLLALAWWVYCQAFELMALTLPVKLFWANMLYLGAGLSTFAFFMLALQHTGNSRVLTKKHIVTVLVIFIVFFCLIFTDGYHGLMRTNISLDTSAVPYVIDKDYGMVFPLYVLLTYGLNAASVSLLLLTALKKRSIYRKKALILLLGVGIIPLSNLGYTLGLSPVTRFDLTPALFWVSGLIVGWAIFRQKLLNIMPIARDLLVERISSGIIVSDNSNILVDINEAALKMFQLEKSEVTGKNIAGIPKLAKNLPPLSKAGEQTTITYWSLGKKFLYEINTHLLQDAKGRPAGALWVIEDITEAQKNMEKLVRQEKALTVMAEREKLSKILHDGLGQVFGYYNTQGQAIREHLNRKKYEAARKHLSELVSVSRDHHLLIRQQIADIRGVSGVNKSFSASLKQYAAGFSKKHGIPVDISLDDNLPAEFPDHKTSLELLAIIQEALTNVQKHAGACAVNILFNRKGSLVELTISDSGTGFDSLKDPGPHSHGLAIMRERAAEIGASMTIKSGIDKGTSIVIKIAEGEQKHEDSDCG